MKSCKKQKKKTKVEKYSELEDVRVTAFEDGRRYGRKIGIAMSLLERGVAIEIIANTTGLSLSEIEKLNNPILNNEGFDE